MSDQNAVVEGPMWAARNWSADAGEGSIHDDSTAEKLGFRGGTVAGDIHMNQFPPVLLKVFGQSWFEHGNLSLNFKNATIDRERVQAFAETRQAGSDQVRVWMEREDGMLVCTGTAAVGDHSGSALRAKDLRSCSPDKLRILNRVHAGMSLGEYEVEANPEMQFERYDANLISDPIDWYRNSSPWGEPVAAPCTLIQYLWGYPMQTLGQYVGDSVGLFGAIEVGHVNGPFLLNHHYRLVSEVVCVGESPQTEFIWYDTTAYKPSGEAVATMRMQSRVMKASSPEYQ